jgi:uncharacterized surface protein with fasciclin (FAS1) repeats
MVTELNSVLSTERPRRCPHMRKTLVVLAATAITAAALVVPVAPAAPERYVANDIVTVAAANGNFKTLAALLTKAGLVKTLQSRGPFTVFAPTDAAFNKVPKATLDQLGTDKALLKKVLLYHVVSGKVPASKVVTLSGKSVKTVAGPAIAIKMKSGGVYLNGNSKVTTADVMTSNGVIHVVNKVLLPPS